MSSSTYEVTLQTSDNETLTVNWAVFRKFGILYSAQDDPAAPPQDPIPLQVDAATLKKVVEYCEYHKDDEDETTPQEHDSFENSPTEEQQISEWDSRFIQVDDKMLFSIIIAANYLDIKPLLKLGAATVANLIKGKTPEEMRRILTAGNDFTPEEEAHIMRENEWHEDRPESSLLD
ncbi:hypothetical protein OPQ81_003137 [Rhizoctonia solani]|nr:hypothetical protein OPQ81_003137 [Rhizoctonia solani]